MSVREAPDALSRLSVTDVAVAELKALAGEGLTKTGFLDIVRSAGVASPDGKAWSTQKINDCVQRLTGARVALGDGSMNPAWLRPLVLRLALRPNAASLAMAVRGGAPKSWREGGGYSHYRGRKEWPYHDAHLDRAARLMVLANDEAEVERLIGVAEAEARSDGYSKPMASVMLEDAPADPALLQRLSPGLRDRLTSSRVELLLDHGRAAPDLDAVIAAAPGPEGDWSLYPRLDLALLRLDILDERPDAARARIPRIRQTSPVTALAADAVLAFLTGSADAAGPLFREALKQHRKAAGKRKIGLPAEFGRFHLMALFAANDIALHPEIETLLAAAEAAGSMLVVALSCLHALVQGQEHYAKTQAESLATLTIQHSESADPLSAALTTLALAVVDGANAERRDKIDRQVVSRWGGQSPLALRILAAVHARFPSPGSGAADFWANKLAALGPGYARDFLEIVPIRPAWDRALEKLRGFLSPPPEDAKAAAANPARRLVFRFDAVTLEITPFEQAAKGAGWTVGRPVAVKRLYLRDAKLDYLTAEDQQVMRTLRLRRDYYGDSHAFDPVRGPAALVGHPRVFDAAQPDQAVEVIAYPVELVVRETRGLISIDLSHRAALSQVFVEPETTGRWRLIEVTPALVDLASVLGPGGLMVPKEARERVVALITTENPRLPVRSELVGVATGGVIGDPRPVLQIAPDGGGFHVRARVRPLGETGPAYVPGHGSRSVLVNVAGAHRRVDRDLAAEVAALEAVVEVCPALASWRDSDHDWRIDELDAALEALQQLHDFAGPLALEWPQGAAIKPTRTVGAKAMSLNIVSGKDWFEVKGQIQVDEGLVIDMAEILAQLGRTPGRFVALDDGRYLALTEDLRRRLDAFSAVTEGSKGGRRIGAVGAGALEDLVETAGVVKADRRWTDLIERMSAARGYQPELPGGLEAELRDYQVQGFTWLARLSRLGLGACLADDMGLGKTVQTLALLITDAAKGPSLVIAPTSVCHNWALEAAKFAPALRVHMLAGAPDRAALVATMGPGDVLVASYGLLHTEADLLASRRFAVVVFDEAQNLKNAETRRAQASKRVDAAFRLALSGTPVENRLDELWSLFDTVTPGLLGSREGFQRRFSGPIEKGAIDKGAATQARQALRTLVRPYLLRRTKAAVLTELPSRTEITLEVEPGAEERAFYEALRRRALENLAGGGEAGGQKRIRILAEITRLRRAACHPALIEPDAGLESAKLAALLELVDELRAGRHRALVFSQFTGHLDLVEAALRARGVKLLRLDGSTPAKARPGLVEAFQAGQGDVFLISLKAGGSGLNLTGADYVIHLDPWWNPAVEDQATDRAHRIGQTRPVTVYRLVSKDSIEEQILSLHAAKRTLSADILEDSEAAGVLGENELMALIRG